MRLVYCLLSPTFGMHQYTADLANRMVEHHEIHLVTVSSYPADRYAPDVHVHSPADLDSTGLSLTGLGVKTLLKFRAALESLKPDLVHFTGPHLWNPYLLAWLRKRGTPVIHTLHDLEPHSGTPLRPLLKVWNKSVLRQADRIVIHGQRFQRQLVRSGIPEDQISYLPLLHLFLGYQRTKILNNDLGEVTYDPLILFFGRIKPYKDVGTLIEAYHRFQEYGVDKNCKDQKLILAGPGNLPAEWEDKLPPGVIWHNNLIADEEAESLFRRCSILVLPYSDATQSALIAAAYFFHKPVVVTRSGALPEYVSEGETGFVVPPSDVGALASKLQIALSDSGRLKVMGDSSRKWYDENRSRETDALAKLYEISHTAI